MYTSRCSKIAGRGDSRGKTRGKLTNSPSYSDLPYTLLTFDNNEVLVDPLGELEVLSVRAFRETDLGAR